MTTAEVNKNKDPSQAAAGTHYDDLVKIRSDDGLFCPCCSKRLRDEVDVIEHIKEETCYRIVPHPHSTKLVVALLRDASMDFEGPGFEMVGHLNQPTFLQQKSHESSKQNQKVKFRRACRSYRCKDCPSVFIESSDLQEHIVKTHPDTAMNKTPFECDLCSFSSASFDSLMDHEDEQHCGLLGDEEIYANSFKCEECTCAFLTKQKLNLHQMTHIKPLKSFKCDKCSAAFQTHEKLFCHEKVHTDRTVKCQFCPSLFHDDKGLRHHMEIHTKEKKYKCDLCSYASRSKSKLFHHHRTHSGEKPYKCGECPKVFAQQHSLVVHERTHSGLKPFKCDQCSYTCTRKCYLISHKRVHSGEKPFKCVHCPYAAANKSNLNSHVSKHYS